MRKVFKTIEVELIEYICNQCNAGVYRFTGKHSEDGEKWLESSVIANHPTMFEMKCSHCGRIAQVGQPYPVLRYKLNDFVLKKHTSGKIEALRRLLRRYLSNDRTRI